MTLHQIKRGMIRVFARLVRRWAHKRHLAIECVERPAALVSQKSIDQVVCQEFGFSRVSLSSARRDQALVTARHVAMMFYRENLNLSLPEIGRRFGNRDHTTVLHALRTLPRKIHASDALFARVERCRAKLAA